MKAPVMDTPAATPMASGRAGVALFVGAAVLVAYAALLLGAESQMAIAGLLLAALIAAVLAPRLGLTARLREASVSAPRLPGLLAGVGVIVVLAVFHDTHFALMLLATVLLYATVCLGLNVQFGYSGVVNFAGAAFFGMGSYTAAVLTTQTGVPALLAPLIGGAIAALTGSLLILPVLRTRGHYAALVTIAFGILFKTFLEVNDALGGPQGLKMPGLRAFGWNFADNIEFTLGGQDIEISFYAGYVLLALLLCALTFVLTRRLERSWIGLSMDMVRTDETAAAVFGVDIARWKVVAFTLGNFVAGMAGAVYGMMTGYVAPNNFTFADSLILVSILILGGIGNPWGIFPAAAIVLILPEKFQFIQEYRFLLYALLVIVILLFRPEGLLPRGVRAYFPERQR